MTTLDVITRLVIVYRIFDKQIANLETSTITSKVENGFNTGITNPTDYFICTKPFQTNQQEKP